MERVLTEELLDSDEWPATEIASSLRSIRRVNLLYGGNRTHKRLFRRVAARLQEPKLKILEVAAGHADVLQAASPMLIKKNIELQISLLDRSAQHLPQGNEWSPDLPQPDLLVGDALRLPMPDESVDVVSCCLFLHHLSQSDTETFLQEALRVSRVAVLINDLERTRIHYFLAQLGRLVDPSRLSRHDGPASVRQSYTFHELHRMLEATKRQFELKRSFLYRLGAIVWKQRLDEKQ